jgi:hypothetical protein
MLKLILKRRLYYEENIPFVDPILAIPNAFAGARVSLHFEFHIEPYRIRRGIYVHRSRDPHRSGPANAVGRSSFR